MKDTSRSGCSTSSHSASATRGAPSSHMRPGARPDQQRSVVTYTWVHDFAPSCFQHAREWHARRAGRGPRLRAGSTGGRLKRRANGLTLDRHVAVVLSTQSTSEEKPSTCKLFASRLASKMELIGRVRRSRELEPEGTGRRTTAGEPGESRSWCEARID